MKVIIYSLILVLISCAGKNLVDGGTKKEDLVQVFEIDDERMKKFITKKKSKTKQKVQRKKIEKKKPRTKKNQSKVVNEETVSDVTPVEQTSVKKVNPEDHEKYPKNFKKYNKKYGKYWDMYEPVVIPGERFKFEINWSVFSAGFATIETLDNAFIGEDEVNVFKATLESAEYFEKIYKLKNTLLTYVKKERFFPKKYSLKQRESSQIVDDLQLFDEDELKTYFMYNRLKEGKTKKRNKEKYVPKYFTDSFSVLHFLRGMPLAVGAKFEFPVITRTKVWLLNARVDKIERITVMGKRFRAYRVRAETRYPGVLKKRGDIIFWFSADNLKKILKFEAKVKIGTVKGTLTSYKQ